MENRQTKLVETVDLLFQTRVQFPPSPQLNTLRCGGCFGINMNTKNSPVRGVVFNFLFERVD